MHFFSCVRVLFLFLLSYRISLFPIAAVPAFIKSTVTVTVAAPDAANHISCICTFSLILVLLYTTSRPRPDTKASSLVQINKLRTGACEPWCWEAHQQQVNPNTLLEKLGWEAKRNPQDMQSFPWTKNWKVPTNSEGGPWICKQPAQGL